MRDLKRRLYMVILAGGRGERFWPQSRFDMPKQNLKLLGPKTMLQKTFSRALSIVPADKIYVVTGAECAGKTARDLPRVSKSRMLIEPCGRNTAAAIGWASAVISGRDPDAIIAVTPSDHLIGNNTAFKRDILLAAKEASSCGSIVTIGIKPSHPSTGYGYIEVEKGPSGKGRCARPVIRFVEKPDKARAARFVKSGRHFWNSGVFICEAGVMLGLVMIHMPRLSKMTDAILMTKSAKGMNDKVRRFYPGLDNVSIDYGIMEKRLDTKMVTASFEWDDLGSWDSIARFGAESGGNSRVIGDYIGLDNEGCIFVAGAGQVLAAIGLKGYTVVTSEGATLIAKNDRLQDVKKLVAMLKKEKKLRKHLYS